MALVIKSWRADATSSDSEGNFVVIECRQEGLLAYVLTMLGISPISTIKVGSERVEFTTGSLEGFTRRMIPLGGICSTYYGYIRPLRAAILLAIVLLFSIVPLGFAAHPIVGVVALGMAVAGPVLYYLLNKKLALGFVENSGVISGVQFKRSLIEGQKIEEDDARRVCQLVQMVIEAREVPVTTAKYTSPSTNGFPVSPANTSSPVMPPALKSPGRLCPKCKAQVGDAARTCGVCDATL
jgi:hypothetical protein